MRFNFIIGFRPCWPSSRRNRVLWFDGVVVGGGLPLVFLGLPNAELEIGGTRAEKFTCLKQCGIGCHFDCQCILGVVAFVGERRLSIVETERGNDRLLRVTR